VVPAPLRLRAPTPRRSSRRAWFAVLGILAAGAGAAAQSKAPAAPPPDLETTLAMASARVEEFFTRAASLVVTEQVVLQPLSNGLSGEGPGRTVESELRLSWTPGADGDGATEAQALRVVTKVNGRRPRPNDRGNCTTPEQHDTETQVLSMLLRSQRESYAWTIAGLGKVDGRPAILVDYREKAAVTVDVKMVENNDDCVSYDIEGGLRGRIWLDAESYDVLRMDQRMQGMIEVPLPLALRRRPGVEPHWTVERLDTTYRFKRVRFDDPEETLVLPVSTSSLRITRGAGTPRLRINTEYKGYRRFLTGGRLITEPKEQN
jgi:hypothetical protein